LNPKPADHTSKTVIGARTDEELHNIIKMGGGVVGKPTMPATPQYSDKDVADVIAYLRQISSTEHH
jgi:mono/diheme cytochrome c family protein